MKRSLLGLDRTAWRAIVAFVAALWAMLGVAFALGFSVGAWWVS